MRTEDKLEFYAKKVLSWMGRHWKLCILLLILTMMYSAA